MARSWTWVRVMLAAGALLACASQERDGQRGVASVAPQAMSQSALDAAIARHWAEHDVEPSPPASDAEFLRRVSLDLRGRVPTRAEAEAFLADSRPDKRARLVDEVLGSEEFAEYWAGLWTAALLPDDARARRFAAPLEATLAASLHAGRSWAEVVEALLTARGELVVELPGGVEAERDAAAQAQAFLLGRAARRRPRSERAADLAVTSARVFLGARIECAQCHDHPYADFSQADFWAQAAWFGRTQVSVDRSRRDAGQLTVAVHERARGELRVELESGSGRGEQVVAPRYMGMGRGSPAPAEEEQEADRRARLAAAIVADPRFAAATAQQVWTRLFGRGVGPSDLLEGSSPSPLLDALASELRAHDYDQRALIRAIVLSRAYACSSAGPGDARQIHAAEAAFARAAVRPLSAEQLFASVLVVTGLEQVEGRAFRQAVARRRAAAEREYALVFDDDELAPGDAADSRELANVPQALLRLNGALTNHGVVARPGGTLARILADDDDTDARLTALWLTLYARPPSEAELELGRAAIAGSPGDASVEVWEDLMFALLYSTEFASNH